MGYFLQNTNLESRVKKMSNSYISGEVMIFMNDFFFIYSHHLLNNNLTFISRITYNVQHWCRQHILCKTEMVGVKQWKLCTKWRDRQGWKSENKTLLIFFTSCMGTGTLYYYLILKVSEISVVYSSLGLTCDWSLGITREQKINVCFVRLFWLETQNL